MDNLSGSLMDAETQQRIAKMEISLTGLVEKLAPLPEMVKAITVMQERQSSHTTMLDTLQKRDSDLQGAHENFATNCTAKLTALDLKIATVRGIWIGAMAIMTLVGGLTTYLVKNGLDHYEQSLMQVHTDAVSMNDRLRWVEFRLGKAGPDPQAPPQTQAKE